MDQASVTVNTHMHLHPEMPVVPFLGLVQLRIPLSSFVLGGAWGSDQVGLIPYPVIDQVDAPAKGCKAGIWINASSTAESLCEYNRSIRYICNIDASEYGGRPLFSLDLG